MVWISCSKIFFWYAVTNSVKNELGKLSKFITGVMYKALRQKLNIFGIKDFLSIHKRIITETVLKFLQRVISKSPMKIKPLLNMRENLYCSTNNKPGSKKKANAIAGNFYNLLEFLYFISSHANIAKIA